MEIIAYICYGLFGLFMLICIYKIGEAIA